MAIELEIQDGSPWYLSPNVWVIADPSNPTESVPIAGTACYLMSRVRNNGASTATNAIVRFYWSNPAISVSRNTANLVGQAFVTLAPADVQEVLCLAPWVPEFLNEGHECILAEAFHQQDPLPATIDFNVPTDRHVAQRNLSVVQAANMMFHMNFEMHNNQRIERGFTVQVMQIPINQVIKNFPQIENQFKIKDKKEGKLIKWSFTKTLCADPNFKDNNNHNESFKLVGFGKKQMALTGQIDGDFAFVSISQQDEKKEIGGLGILIINQ